MRKTMEVGSVVAGKIVVPYPLRDGTQIVVSSIEEYNYLGEPYVRLRGLCAFTGGAMTVELPSGNIVGILEVDKELKTVEEEIARLKQYREILRRLPRR
ncbi:hypothetical protein [Bacillus cereus group sp. N21]|uniref:hypothetical protein n=1 Tax=Bacillus cereus group sp. N21 TaxID=2794591 RepID=UPI0018F5A450|nr:hypothetical protein [Bacillus cereus group sp. N21]MBJ8027274.1 hypothetical protein [Bacillus cereus group sp. N21]